MKKLLLIINPAAGRRSIAQNLLEVIDVLVRGGYDVSVYTTSSAQDLCNVVADRCDSFDIITCCGGDGTLNLTLSSLYKTGSKTIAGYIPSGSTNDFGTSRDIPCDAVEAARKLITGKIRNIDLGLLNSNVFSYVSAFGVFADVSYLTPRQMKQNIGYAAYIIEGIKSLGKITPYPAIFEYDGGFIQGDFIYGMATNTKRVGGIQLPMIHDSAYDDGLMEVTLVKHPKNVSDSQKLINVLLSQVPDNEMVYHFQTNRISYNSEKSIPWSVDGEFGGSYTECEIRLIPAALRMKY